MAVDYLSTLNAGSGLNTTQIVDALVDAERAPRESAITKTITQREVSISALAQTKSTLSALNTTIKNVKGQTGYAVSASDDAINVTVSDSSKLTANSFDFEVTQLADYQTTAFLNFAARDSAIGEGTMSFSFGTWDVGNTSFTQDGTRGFTVTIDETNNTLDGIATAINAAQAGVNATVVGNGDGTFSLLVKGATGEINGFSISVTEDPAVPGLNVLDSSVYDANEMVQVAQDLEFKIDGVTASRSSNTVSDLIDGLKIDVKAVTSSTTVSVALDQDLAFTQLSDLVTSLNGSIALLTEISKPGINGEAAGPLAGDSTVRAIKSRLGQFSTTELLDYDGSSFFLANFGLQTERDGSFTLDRDKFDTFFAENPTAFSAIFSNGLSSSTDTIYPRISGTDFRAGTYNVVAEEATSGTYTGNAPSNDFSANPYVITGTTTTLDITLDGAPTETITLTAGTYNDLGSLASMIETQANSALGAGSLTVTVENGALVFTSSNTGADSTVSLGTVSTSLNTYLGINNGVAADGIDRVVTVGDVVADIFGSSYRVSGGDAAGLILGVDSFPTTGSVIATKSLTTMISTYLDSINTSSGTLSSKITALTSQTEEQQAELAELDTKMENLRERYMLQYAAMESAVSSLKKTGDYLTSFMDSWSASLKK